MREEDLEVAIAEISKDPVALGDARRTYYSTLIGRFVGLNAEGVNACVARHRGSEPAVILRELREYRRRSVILL